MIVYHRNCYKPEALSRTTQHVIQHISSIASADDDPERYANEVEITYSENEDGSTRVYGELDRDPSCDYSLPAEFQDAPESQYQQGFGERIMTPEQLEVHLLEKENRK